MNRTPVEAYGALVLRVALGVVWIAHSLYLKYFVYSLAGTAQYFDSIGLPAVLTYVVFAAEIAGGVALIVGVFTRLAALGLIPIALGATWTHLGAGWLFSNAGGGWEYPAFLTVALIAQALLGSGAFALELGREPRQESAGQALASHS